MHQAPQGILNLKALDALQLRTSSPRLTGPAPDDSQLENIFRAAMRAADHGLLRPWRFLIIRDDARNRLGELFLKAALEKDPEMNTAQRGKLQTKPLRAPMIIVSISSPKEHPKVPELEQDLSAAAATQNMINAAYALNIGAMWRTGSAAFSPTVKAGLGVQANEKIVGFLYLGTPDGPAKPQPNTDYSDLVQEW